MLKFTKAAYLREEDGDPEGGYLEILPIEQIRANPYQPRKYFSDQALSELAASIRQIGLIQPISVRRVGPDRYELIAGERRLRASRLAGLRTIRAYIMTAAFDHDVAMMAMIENLQRENLNFFEEADGMSSLIREHGFTQDELAKRLSKNQSTIANKLRLLKLPRSVRERILQHGLTERHARALLRLHNEELQLSLIAQIAKDGLSVKSTEELVEAGLKKLYGEEPAAGGGLTKARCCYTLYINTLKKSLEKINSFGASATLDYTDRGDYLEVIVKIRKQDSLPRAESAQ